MTEKRFMLDDCGELIDLNNHKFIDYGEECCNLLNELHEENKELKEKLDDILELTELTGMIHLRKAEIKSIINR